MTTQAEETLAAFRLALAGLVGTKCRAAVAGPSTGSLILLIFGDKISLFNKDEKERESSEEKFKLYVECVWRLDGKEAVICGAWDDNRFNGPMLNGLACLEGASVESAELREPGLDLRLRFSGDMNLWIFCDQVNEISQIGNYDLSSPEMVFKVTYRSRLECEMRNRPKLHAVPRPE